MKAISSFLIFAVLSLQAQAGVVQLEDKQNRCTRYVLVDEVSPEGAAFYNELLGQGAKLISTKSTYGFSYENLRIDFDRRIVKMDVLQRVAMGFNRTLIKDVVIKSDAAELHLQTNRLNYSMRLMTDICIGANQELVRAE